MDTGEPISTNRLRVRFKSQRFQTPTIPAATTSGPPRISSKDTWRRRRRGFFRAPRRPGYRTRGHVAAMPPGASCVGRLWGSSVGREANRQPSQAAWIVRGHVAATPRGAARIARGVATERAGGRRTAIRHTSRPSRGRAPYDERGYRAGPPRAHLARHRAVRDSSIAKTTRILAVSVRVVAAASPRRAPRI